MLLSSRDLGALPAPHKIKGSAFRTLIVHPLRFGSTVVLALLHICPVFAADPAAEVAAFTRFHREINVRLLDSRERHKAMHAALASASYEATMNLIKIEEAKDKEAVRVVAATAVPAELKEYAGDIERARLQAVGALEARAERNERVAAIREKSYAVMVEGILAQLKGRR